MELADWASRFLLTFISLSIFIYCTFWVTILVSIHTFPENQILLVCELCIRLLLIMRVLYFQPFVDSDRFIHQYFLLQEYAILIPVFAGVVLLCFLCIFIRFVTLKSKKKKAWCIYVVVIYLQKHPKILILVLIHGIWLGLLENESSLEVLCCCFTANIDLTM